MVRICSISCIPSWDSPSNRPTNGLTYVAPALAASSACMAENTRVTLVFDVFCRQRLAGNEALAGHGQLDDHIVAEPDEVLRFPFHLDGGQADDLQGYGAIHFLADTFGLIPPFAAFASEQRGIGGHAVNQPLLFGGTVISSRFAVSRKNSMGDSLSLFDCTGRRPAANRTRITDAPHANGLLAVIRIPCRASSGSAYRSGTA